MTFNNINLQGKKAFGIFESNSKKNSVKNKIVSFVIDKIKSKDNTIEFTTVSDLISVSEFYLGDSTVARALQNALIQENVLEQINYLLSICENNGIK